MTNPRIKKIAATFAALLIFTFLGYQIYRVNFAKQVTEEALYKTVSEKIQATGYAIRSENVITNPYGGVLQYAVSDGGRVSSNGTVATAYSSVTTAGTKDQLDALKNEKQLLTDLQNPGNSYADSLETVGQQISKQMISLLNNSESGTSITTDKQQLQYLLNKRQIIAGKSPDFSSRLSEIETQITQLSGTSNGQALGTVTTDKAGFFSSHVDGYENLFPINSVTTLTADDLEKEYPKGTVQDHTVGKVVNDFFWYFACTVPAKDANRFKLESTVTLSFPFASADEIPATVIAINQQDENSDAAIILKCDRMNANLVNLRKETAEITVNQYSGIQVSQKAIHFETLTKDVKQADGTVTKQTQKVPGVYVMYGSEIRFCQIVQLYGDGTYVYCDPSPSADALMTDDTVKQYDQVIIEGTDLYDGKVID